jgi:voltage-gated potassium channel
MVRATRSEERARRGSRLDARMRRVVANRRIFPFLALATVAVALLAAFLARLVDEKDFPTFGDAVWWAVVTLGTVGYGDIVPTTTAGRIVGGGLIVFGVTFLSFLAATVISMFIAEDQKAHDAEEWERQDLRDAELRALLQRVEERLAAIEDRLPP